MSQEESKKITYKEFMKQLDKVKEEMGRDMYERLEAKFGKAKNYKTA